VLIVLERANQALYRTGTFSLAGGDFAFSKREFPVALAITPRFQRGR